MKINDILAYLRPQQWQRKTQKTKLISVANTNFVAASNRGLSSVRKDEMRRKPTNNA